MNLILQAAPPSFWNAPPGSAELFIKIAITLLLGMAGIFALLKMPATLRRPVVATFTFLAGSFYVMYYLWPAAVDRQRDEMPRNAVEGVSFWLDDALPVVANFTNILTAFLLGLGVYSLLRIHGKRFFKFQRDWQFSFVLIASMVGMIIFGYADWYSRNWGPNAGLQESRDFWDVWNYGRHFLFEGLLQQMDAAMFSIIAFYILSAAYRAFRVRSVEATILLATALLVILSFMGVVEQGWAGVVNPGGGMEDFQANFTLRAIAQWVRDSVQTAAIRGIDFGIGIGALAMALRLWLSLEKSNMGGS
jgi:hypothetical protein